MQSENNCSKSLANVTNSIHDRQRESSVTFPFETLQSALNYVQKNIPGRQRYPNFFELERHSKPYFPDFHPQETQRVWCRVLKSIQRILLKHHRDARRAWMLCNLGDRTSPTLLAGKNPHEERRMRELSERRGERVQIHPRDAAKLFRVHPRTIYRWFDAINEDLEAEFARRRLIPPVAPPYATKDGQSPKD